MTNETTAAAERVQQEIAKATEVSNDIGPFPPYTISNLLQEVVLAKTAGRVLVMHLAETTRELAEAQAALKTIRASFQLTKDQYDENGPEWTSRANGEEYYGAAYVLGTADETIAIIDAALAITPEQK
jgi:hypothetical protein